MSFGYWSVSFRHAIDFSKGLKQLVQLFYQWSSAHFYTI